jgi:hypothetical protein
MEHADRDPRVPKSYLALMTFRIADEGFNQMLTMQQLFDVTAVCR